MLKLCWTDQRFNRRKGKYTLDDYRPTRVVRRCCQRFQRKKGAEPESADESVGKRSKDVAVERSVVPDGKHRSICTTVSLLASDSAGTFPILVSSYVITNN